MPLVVTMRAISLGGGVQSTVMTLRADAGDFGPIPDVAIWADTQWDPPTVRATVEWVASQVSFPVEIVTAGNLAEDTRRGLDSYGNHHYTIPAFAAGGMTRRHCTTQYKITPIKREIRRLLGYQPRQRIPVGAVEQWMGISWDELHRTRDNRDRWITNRYPLVEARITRRDCMAWWDDNAPADAPPLGRSSCVGCPYHSRREWAELSEQHPELLAEAAEIEADLRADQTARGYPATYLHRRRIPLLEAIAADQAQSAAQPELDLWGDECAGVCGV